MVDELLDVVNELDVVIEQAMRSTVHARGLWHRGVHVFLFDNGGRLLVQKRSADRKQYPALWDCSVSEHVKSGESYDEAIRRGLREELGVDGVDVQPMVNFKLVYGPNDNEISTLYRGVVEPEKVKFDPIEIESIQWLEMNELKIMMIENRPRFCGWFIEMMNWYWDRPSALTVLQGK